MFIDWRFLHFFPQTYYYSVQFMHLKHEYLDRKATDCNFLLLTGIYIQVVVEEGSKIICNQMLLLIPCQF